MSPIKASRYHTPLKLRSNERRALLLVGDLLMQLAALVLALYFWAVADANMEFSLTFIQSTPPWFFLLPISFLVLISGLYEQHRAADESETLKALAIAAILALMIYMTVYFLLPPRTMPRRGVFAYYAAALVLTLIWRMVYIRVFTAPHFMRRVLLIGGGETGQILMRIIKETFPPPFLLVGIIDDDPEKLNTQIEGVPVMGTSAELQQVIDKNKITDLIVAISGKMQSSMFQSLMNAHESGTEITRMPVAYEEMLGRIPIRILEADWILRNFVDQIRGNVYYDIAKRTVDLLGSLLFLLCFLPAVPFICIAILLDSGFPILYRQIRLGRGGQPYQMFKFRTMVRDAEPDGLPRWAKENDTRATRIGAFLRKTHLDEIPQFVNVLRGEMSIVGPRAERPELIDWFEGQVPFYRARLLVKPGITGWAQVNQSYAATIEETIIKLEYDLYYIKKRSLWTDVMVILRTPGMIFGLRGR